MGIFWVGGSGDFPGAWGDPRARGGKTRHFSGGGRRFEKRNPRGRLGPASKTPSRRIPLEDPPD